MQSVHNSSFSPRYSPAPPRATVHSVNIPLLCSGVIHRLQCGYLLLKLQENLCSGAWRTSSLPSLTLISAEVPDTFSFLIFPSHHSVVVLPFLNQVFPDELPACLRGSAVSPQWWVHWNQLLADKVTPLEHLLKEAAPESSPMPTPWQGHT